MDPCDRNFTITHQTDIDDGPLVLCLGSENTNINIRNATRTLTFSNLTKTDGIDVQNSPQLEILNFPNLRRTHYIEISQATSLTNVSFPRLRNCSGINNLPFFDLTINGTRSLKSFALPDSSCIKNLVLSDIRPSNWTALDPDWTVSPEFASWNISDALDVYIDACIPLSSLKSALNLGISVQDCGFGLDELTSVANFSLANVTGSSFLSAPLQIQENMLLESSIRLDSVYFAENPSYVQADSIPLDLVGTIGGDLNITSNGNLHIAYDNLTEVGKSLSIRNNTNCTFNFDKFSVVNTLIFADNVDTKLPQFISLERAQNIHIHGLMDLSTGPNILPALIDVAGNVTVEPWNDDFDCSKLVSQWKDQIIHNLKCNGRNNETETPAPKSDNGTNTPIPTTFPSKYYPNLWAIALLQEHHETFVRTPERAASLEMAYWLRELVIYVGPLSLILSLDFGSSMSAVQAATTDGDTVSWSMGHKAKPMALWPVRNKVTLQYIMTDAARVRYAVNSN
ncbi:hypothetical protein CHU98_g11600 [Xylaria longipes]|nr:hypothetical protein CHU98_g11600 [Xylaria longipes]